VVPKFVPVSHEAPFGSRSYITLGYTPKKYNTRPKSAIIKYTQIREEKNEKSLVESTVRKVPKKVKIETAQSVQDVKKVVEF
jgi:hypothetical protein